MALEALQPLKLSIVRLLNSCPISIESQSREILQTAYNVVESAIQFVESLKEFSHQFEIMKFQGLEACIREAARELEDVVDSHVSDQILSQSITLVIRVEEDINVFAQNMKKVQKLFNPWFNEEDGGESDVFGLSDQSRVTRSMFMSWFATKAVSIFLGEKEDYIQDLEKLLPEEDDEDDYGVLLTSDFYGIKYGLMSWWINKAVSAFVMEKEDGPPLLEEVDDVVADVASSRTEPDVNMVGLLDQFCQVRDDIIEEWGTTAFVFLLGMAGIGKTALAKKIFNDPLVMSKFEGRIFVRMGPEYQFEELIKVIPTQLNPEGDKMFMDGGKRYLIVLDDVWDQNLYHKLKRVFPYGVGGCSILITTRIKKVVDKSTTYVLPLLNKKESWDLLRGKIFFEEKCVPELEKAGKKIAENCEGLPLLIVKVANLLSKAERTVEYWNEVAANKTNSIFISAYEEILEVLYPSYNFLPQHLKTCFFYMGAFPQNSVVQMCKLINLWSAEGFVDASYKSLRGYVEEYFEGLVTDHNMAFAPRRSKIQDTRPKACELHSVFWYLSKRVAWNNKFLHVLNRRADATVEKIEKRRRLSIYKSSIFSIKDVHDTIASTCSFVRSLLCTGPYHHYQIPIFFGLRLLKVLDSLSIRFYEFPMEVVKLVHLRYLALTCNGNFPPSISKLWNLQCLILHPYLSINSGVSESYVPVEIWDLQELEHLQIIGRNLPDPPHAAVLEKLSTLLDVGAHTCTKSVIKSIPNLQKLRVRIEMTPDANEPLSFYDEVSHLEELTSLQCVIVNPYKLIAPTPSVFPSYLLKLNLSGFGYPWEDMDIIAQLPQLQVLRLKCSAFRGESWDVKEMGFEKLLHLSIEDADLVTWSGGYESFVNLATLTIKNCYKLQEVPDMPSLEEFQIVDCNPSAEACGRQMTPGLCNFYVHYSWLKPTFS